MHDFHQIHHSRSHRHHRMPSPPPPACCSSGTNSSMSQPISLDFCPPPSSIQNVPKENWLDFGLRHHHLLPPKPHKNQNHRLHRQQRPIGLSQFPAHFKGPISLDALIGRRMEEEEEDTTEGDISRERMVGATSMFSTSEEDEEGEEDLTTSDSEICRYGARARAEQRRRIESARRFGKFPSLSTIYPDNSSISLETFDDLMATNNAKREEKAAARGKGIHPHIYMGGSESDTENGQRRRRPIARAPHHHHQSGALAFPSNAIAVDKMPPPSSQSAPRTPQRIPTLAMVEEISPVLPPPDPEEDFDVPPLPRPLQLGRGEWRPLQTSTLTNFHAIMPKTNPRQPQLGAGGGGNAGKGPMKANLLQMPQMDPPRSLFDPYFPQQCSNAPMMMPARPEQFNLPSALANSFGIRGILFIQVAISGPSLLLVHVRNAALFLKNPPASCYVKVEIRRSPSNRKRTKYDHRFRSKQTVECRESNWPEFFDDFQFKVSPVHLKYGDKLGLALYAAQPSAAASSMMMMGAAGGISAPPTELLGRMSFSLRKFFRLAKQRQWGNEGAGGGGGGQQQQEPIQVCQGGFFLLPDPIGQQSHLSQDNILHRKYYDEIGSGGGGIGAIGGTIGGCSSLSSTSSFGSSPFKMMSEPEWPPSAHPSLGGGRPQQQQQQQQQFRGTNLVGGIIGGGQKVGGIGIAQQQGGGHQGGRVLDSSQSSSSQSGIECKRRAAAFPSATTDTTTSDFTSSALTFSSTGPMAAPMATDSFSSGGAEVGGGNANAGGKMPVELNGPAVQIQRPPAEAPPRPQPPQYVRAHSQPNEQPPSLPAVPLMSSPKEGKKQQLLPTKLLCQPQQSGQPCSSTFGQQQHHLNALGDNAVRRVASFTHSPTLLVNPQLYKKRNSVTAGTAMTDRMPRKNLMGPLGKTLHFLKSKLDFSLSASVLCPSKEECRLWQESFEALLNHKYGCMLFREFLQIEFSQENLEFWLECEEFKRMNEAKKAAMQKKALHIYGTYIKPLAPREVNLDSETRMKTEAALEKQPLRTDIFKMAQNKIEQLMAKDSYPRFLKSEQYLELLNEREAAEKSGLGGANSTLLTNGLLRVASAKEGGAKKPVKSGRSPSMSPILSQNRWARRNTCSPASPATLQIPSIQE